MADDAKRFVFDAISAIVLLLVAMGGAFIPRFLMLRKSANGIGDRGLIFQLGNMLSGGVMLSAGLCHLLADALPEISEKVKNFPLGTFLCALGYVVTLVADEIGASVSGHGHHGHSHNIPSPPLPLVKEHGSLENDENNNEEPKTMHPLEIDTASLVNGGQISSDGGVVNNHNHQQLPRVSFITAVLLGAALSLHSVLEGVALGSQKELKSSEDIMLAIFAHKGLAAYALGASLMDSQTSTKRFWCVVMGFAIASPAGILIGYALSTIASGVVSASLSALASGTFLYVATMEVIPKELADPSHKAKKIGVLLLGFGLMSLLAIWA